MDKIQNPHDKFVKEFLSNKSIAIEFLQLAFPKNIAEYFNWDSLTQEKDSFISKDLREQYSDALFSLKLKGTAKVNIYILFEHKSKPSKNIHIQLLQYLSSIYLKQKKLELVLPLVFYHGKEKWNIASSFLEMFQEQNVPREFMAEVKKYIPNFSYVLLNTNTLNIEELQDSFLLHSMLFIMQHIWHLEDNVDLQLKFAKIFNLLLQKNNLQFLETFLKYTYSTQDIELEQWVKLIEDTKLDDNLKEVMMTTAERLMTKGYKRGIEQGIEQGMEKGIEQGREEGIERERYIIIDRMFKHGYTAEQISEITDFPLAKVEEYLEKK